MTHDRIGVPQFTPVFLSVIRNDEGGHRCERIAVKHLRQPASLRKLLVSLLYETIHVFKPLHATVKAIKQFLVIRQGTALRRCQSH